MNKESHDYLFSLQWHGIRPGLRTISSLMRRLDHPHLRFPSVHIAGTNGKGSTAAMIASILQTGGYRIGLYTSPHLIDFSERIRINGIPIPDEKVEELIERGRRRCEGLSPTFFEFTTAMALLCFADEKVDLAVVEVGMGGRCDATNILRPEVSVITNIDYDHRQYLGSTLAQIAREKAGIIKRGTPVVTGITRPSALRVVERISRERGSALYRLGREFSVSVSSPARFSYYGTTISLSGMRCPLPGIHQMSNAAYALATVELLHNRGFGVKREALRRGLASVCWEGRGEVISTRPLILLDGAHNPAAAQALASYLKELRAVTPGKLLLIIGILKDKEIPGIFKALVPLADEVVLTQADHERAAPVSSLLGWVKRYPVRVTIRTQVLDALIYARSVASPSDILCVTGSFYVVGEARAFLIGRGVPSPIRG